MNELTCDRVQDLLPELLQGTLQPSDRRAVDSHLASCEECHEVLDFLRRIEEERPELENLGLETIRAAVAAAFDAAVAASGPARGEEEVISLDSRRHRRRFVSELRWSLPAAAVLVIALGTSQLWNPGGGPTTDLLDFELGTEPETGESFAFFMGDDPVVAGGMVIEELSDEELMALLEELES